MYKTMHVQCDPFSLDLMNVGICCSLSSNSSGDEGARAIADGMKYCTSLQSLK